MEKAVRAICVFSFVVAAVLANSGEVSDFVCVLRARSSVWCKLLFVERNAVTLGTIPCYWLYMNK